MTLVVLYLGKIHTNPTDIIDFFTQVYVLPDNLGMRLILP